MGVTTERLPKSLMSMEIEVEPARLEASMDKAVRRLSQRVRIPGFRPGKAPRLILERTLGKSALIQEALEELLPDVYSETIAAEAIEAIGQPSFDLKSTEPLIVAVTVPVRPIIDLHEYTALRAPREAAEATAEQIEASLTNLRRRYATLDPVDRPVAWGDTVRVDVTVTVDGQAEPHTEEGAEFAVLEGSVVSLPGFLDHLIGLERGGPYTIEYPLPEDFVAEELAGKTAHYTVTMHEVKQEVLPDLDDAFARSLDEGIETVDELQARVKENVQSQIEAQAEGSYQEEVLDLLIASASLDYPDVLVDREADRMLDQESNHASHTPEELERWLMSVGRTEDEVREELRPRADLAVQRALVLAELALKEGIAVANEDVEAELDKMMAQWFPPSETDDVPNEQRDSIRQMFDSEDTRASIRHQLLTTATLTRLTAITSQADGSGDEAARARGSRRRRGARAEGEAGTEGDAGESTTDESPADEAEGTEAK